MEHCKVCGQESGYTPMRVMFRPSCQQVLCDMCFEWYEPLKCTICGQIDSVESYVNIEKDFDHKALCRSCRDRYVYSDGIDIAQFRADVEA